MFEYENLRRIQYKGGATFIPVCITCGRFVKADSYILENWDGGLLKDETNADCKKCGRTNMPFEGYI